MQYWKRKNALPGLNYESDNKLPSGLAKSSALQANETKEGSGEAKANPSDKKFTEKKFRKKVTTTQTKPTPPTYKESQVSEAKKYEKKSQKKSASQTKASAKDD